MPHKGSVWSGVLNGHQFRPRSVAGGDEEAGDGAGGGGVPREDHLESEDDPRETNCALVVERLLRQKRNTNNIASGE